MMSLKGKTVLITGAARSSPGAGILNYRSNAGSPRRARLLFGLSWELNRVFWPRNRE